MGISKPVSSKLKLEGGERNKEGSCSRMRVYMEARKPGLLGLPVVSLW